MFKDSCERLLLFVLQKDLGPYCTFSSLNFYIIIFNPLMFLVIHF